MATYEELHDLKGNVVLRAKVGVGITIGAHEVFGEASPSVARLAWAQEAIGAPGTFTDAAYFFVLAANASATVAQIVAAPDSGTNSVQEAVDAWRDKIYS